MSTNGGRAGGGAAVNGALVFPAAKPLRKRLRQMSLAAVFIAVLAGGWVYPLAGYFMLLCMGVALGMGAYKGRRWCGLLCPRGAFLEVVVSALSPRKRIPEAFKKTPARVGVLVFLLSMIAFQAARRWPDPYSIGSFFVMLITATTVFGVVLALGWHQRAWCRLCPIGTLTSWMGKRKHPLRMDSALCTGCKRCSALCPMQLKPFEHKTTPSAAAAVAIVAPDCIRCGDCVDGCPKGALALR